MQHHTGIIVNSTEETYKLTLERDNRNLTEFLLKNKSVPFWSGPSQRKNVTLRDAVYGIQGQKLLLENIRYEDINLADENFQTLLKNFGNGMVVFLWSMINFFLTEFRTLESKIVSDQQAVNKLYLLLEISIGVITLMKIVVFWYRQTIMTSYLKVYYGFSKRDCT